MAGAKHFLAFLPLLMACLLCFAACTEAKIATTGEGRKLKYTGEPATIPTIPLNPPKKNIETWCIAKPSTDEIKLNNNIDYSCKQTGVNCGVIQEYGACYEPNNIVSHASVVMNLHYRAAGKHDWDCYFDGTAMIVTHDPSVGECIYPA